MPGHQRPDCEACGEPILPGQPARVFVDEGDLNGVYHEEHAPAHTTATVTVAARRLSGQVSPSAERPPCRHDSTRRDGTLDNCCLRCGSDGYWHDGHRHDVAHPSGKTLIRLDCPDTAEEAA